MAEAIGAVCVLLALLVAVIAVVSIRRQRRDRDRLRQWADRNGWALTLAPAVDWGRNMPGGNKHGVRHTFTGVLDGRRVDVAEYSVTDADTNTQHHVITVVRLRRPLPATDVEPRSRAARLAARAFGAGETATGNADFDRAFRIRTAEAGALGRWFSPALIAAHLAGRTPTSWSVQGTELLSHRPGRLEVDQIAGHAAALRPLADLLDGPNRA